MKLHLQIPVLVFIFCFATISAQPPEPEVGTRWVLNENFSDEFNDSILDAAKWYDYNPKWVGRAPAIFLPSQVSLSDGMLQIKNKKLEQDTVVYHWDGSSSTYNIGGGAVASKNLAYFGFYECRMKASKIRMSSTFWMSSTGFPGPNECTTDKYSLEIDIQETVGGANPGSQTLTHMGSNSHYKYTDCDGSSNTYSAGSKIPLNGNSCDTFYTYGAYWKDENGVDLYLNGVKGNSIPFRTDIHPEPFDKPMQINMVTETYDWMRPLPSDEDLANDDINTTYYDWIRAYSLVDVDYIPEAEALLTNPGFETGSFTGWTGWGGNPREIVSDNVHSGSYAAHIVGAGAPEYSISLKANTAYTLSCYGMVAPGSDNILFGIKDANEVVLASTAVAETEYTLKSLDFTCGTETSVKFYFYAPGSGAEGWADDFSLIEVNAEEPELEIVEIFDEAIYIKNAPTNTLRSDKLNLLCGYKANRDLEIALRLLNSEETLIGEQLLPAYAGYGLKQAQLLLDSIPLAGTYTLVADIRPVDGSLEDSISSFSFSLNLVDAVDVEISVLDLRDDSPLEGAGVELGSSSLSTNASGMVFFPDVPPGSSSLTVAMDGFETYTVPELALTRDTSLLVRLAPEAYIVSFEVLDAKSGAPILDAIITVDAMEETTNTSGKAIFSLYEGSYTVNIIRDKYAPYSDTIQVNESTSYSIGLEKMLVNGKIIVKLDDSNLYNALVFVGDQSAATSTLGIANFYDLKRDSTYSWEIEYETKTLLDSTLTLQSDSTIRISLYTTESGDFARPADFGFYPNPATHELILNSSCNSCEYRIISEDGAVVLNGHLDRHETINIESLEAGSYILDLRNYGRKLFIKKE